MYRGPRFLHADLTVDMCDATSLSCIFFESFIRVCGIARGQPDIRTKRHMANYRIHVYTHTRDCSRILKMKTSFTEFEGFVRFPSKRLGTY
jgi:hypothetical protein